ncbi:ATP-binding protein [Azonexus sp.]|uniref:ATP-binding protein n=1 Tax=Azonexus sp. TaxID=1872668 RepID=UPI0035AD79DD
MNLRQKLLVPLLALSLALGAYLHLLWIPHSLQLAERAHVQMVERHLDSVVESLLPLLLGNLLADIHGNLGPLQRKNPEWVGLRLVDHHGRQLYPLLDKAPLVLAGDGASRILLRRPIHYLGTEHGQLEVLVDLREFRAAALARHHELLMLQLGMLLAVTLALALILEFAVIRPARRLAVASAALARRHFHVALPAAGSGEIGSLVGSFAAMRRDLEAYHADLQHEIEVRKRAEASLRDQQEHLEELVAARTRELADAQGQLLQSEKMASIGQLAAGVAHEINNPVGFVTSNLGTLKEYVGTLLELAEACRAGQADEAAFRRLEFDYIRDDVVALLRESQEGLDRVKKIVANLKSFSHVGESEWLEADLNAGVESALSVAWHELKYKTEVVREYGTLPPVPCIAAQINQVVLNLLVNAAQAIETQGRITVRTGCDDAWAWIEVADTGRGMPPDVQKRIFDPFFTTKPVGQGTGLGLSISYDIVRKHGGRIDVHSVPGEGSTFRIWLPLAGQPPATA